MKPDQILQTDLLDILFANRNKAYGAYTLRKFYNERLIKSMSVTGLIVLAFCLFNFIKPAAATQTAIHLDMYVKDVDISKLEEDKPKDKPKDVLQKKYDKPIKQAVFVTPIIVDDKDADKDVPEQKELDKSIIGLTKVDGADAGPEEILPQGNEDNFGKESGKPTAVIKEEPAIAQPLVQAEFMPEFPGGKEAFLRFMLKNLRQPDNLDEGQKIVVRLKFVVDTDGSIKDVAILQSGGVLDSEVMRVVNKMPRWKPGLQNGKVVPVWFNLPVTFVGE